MQHNSEIWLALTHRWAETLKKAKLKQAVIDDKMQSFLRGNGCLPTQEELTLVEQCWEAHVDARNKTNQFIQTVLKNYQATD